MSARFRLDLDEFFGPADLLLQVVRRTEIDVAETRLAAAIGQFDRHWAESPADATPDLDDAAAAIRAFGSLLDLKAESANRRDEPAEDEEASEEDEPVDAAVVERLLTYRRLRHAADQLASRADDASRSYVRRVVDRPDRGEAGADRVRGLEVWDLVGAYVRAAPAREAEASSSAIRRDPIPVAALVRELGERARRDGRVALSAFLCGDPSREKLIGSFLAILELVRHHGFGVTQSDDGAEITLLAPA